jgi:hypothetical protein
MTRPRSHRSERQSRANNRSKEGKAKSMNTPETREAKRPNREGILALFEEDLDGSRRSKVYVDVLGECGPYHKEIGELSQTEMRTLEPGLRIRVVNRLLERYVDELDHAPLQQGDKGPRPREPSLCGSGLQRNRRRLIYGLLTPF